MNRYDKWDDVSLRLANTYCRYKGRAVFVQVPESGWHVVVKDPLAKETYEVDPNDEDNFDISAPELGWADSKHGPQFVFRIPYRSQLQGVSTRLLRAYWPGSTEAICNLDRNGLEICRLINKEYKPFSDLAGIGPWTHKASLAKPYDIHVVCYQGNIVGRYKEKSNSVLLSSKFNNRVVRAELSQVMRVENAHP
jgi:hypothetical protein